MVCEEAKESGLRRFGRKPTWSSASISQNLGLKMKQNERTLEFLRSMAIFSEAELSEKKIVSEILESFSKMSERDQKSEDCSRCFYSTIFLFTVIVVVFTIWYHSNLSTNKPII